MRCSESESPALGYLQAGLRLAPEDSEMRFKAALVYCPIWRHQTYTGLAEEGARLGTFGRRGTRHTKLRFFAVRQKLPRVVSGQVKSHTQRRNYGNHESDNQF